MQQLLFEFESNNTKAGFRLHRLEVWNWGTFHSKVWTIETSGNTSLLTGANGSGKSTLVDALLTLLVPNKKRNYNQASGSGGRKERDELSYVRGAYGKVKSEEDNASNTQYLRTDKDYTVLLAYFFDEQSQQKVTLAIVFWIKEVLHRLFVVVNGELAIASHFSHFSSIKELKKRLEAISEFKVELFDQFVNYSKQFRKLVGLESEKALDLFNQTVSIKEIGKLNDFVREHMLEKADVQTKIQELQEHYQDLTRSHDAILKAKRQLEQLKPLIDEASQFEKLKDEVTNLERCAAIIPAYFAQEKIILLQQKKAESEAKLVHVHHHRTEINRELDDLGKQNTDLEIAISNDEKGQRIRELKRDIQHLDERLSNKKKQAEKYNEITQCLNLPDYSDETTFLTSRHKGNALRQTIDEHLEKLSQNLRDHQIQRSRLKEQCDELNQELQSLKLRKSQIPENNLKVRSRILTDLELSESEIPFIGELLKVKDEERQWEGAIEQLLHSFGLCLIVPEKHYQSFNQYVNKTNLKGRIVYYKVSEHRSYPLVRVAEDFVFNKLEINPNSEFSDWIKNELISKFDYVCCENVEQFSRESRAIMKGGLTKHSNARHEKDDRRAINDRKNYILGWNNIDKINAIEAELFVLMKNLGKQEKAIQDIEKQRKQCDRQKEWLQDFIRFEHFSDIDWKSCEIEKQKLVDQKKQLEESSDNLKLLQGQLEAINSRLKEKEKERTASEKDANNIERDLQEYDKQEDNCKTINILNTADSQIYISQIKLKIKNKDVAFDTIDILERQEQQSYTENIDKKKDSLRRLQISIEKKMHNYKQEYADTTTNVDASVEAINDFVIMLEAIERDDLPRHEKRFRNLLRENVIKDITFFKNSLEAQHKNIKDSINNLNDSLKTIDYTGSTYIQLQYAENRDNEIQEFRNTLRTCFPNLRETPEDNEASFQKIKALLERFKNEERWKLKVTDVLNWLNFSASEKYQGDGSQKHYYSDSSGLSGGQKAKLAYTILASAIAYQFGLNHIETKPTSFRFVVVDEAFSKSDNDNAKYAMELFKKLNLQLMVVTPLDKINIVENYINAVHFVTNNSDENNSKIHSLSMSQIRKNRKSFHLAAADS